jgi:hypothetical protein
LALLVGVVVEMPNSAPTIFFGTNHRVLAVVECRIPRVKRH